MKKNKQWMEQEQSPKRRRPGSLVFKLTFRQVARLFWMMVVVDILVVGLYACVTLAVSEQKAARLYALGPREALAQTSVLDPGVSIALTEEEIQGWGLHNQVEKRLDTPYGTSRTLSLNSGEAGVRIAKWQGRPVYTVVMPLEGGEGLLVAFDLSESLGRFYQAMLILWTVQGILLFFTIFSTRRSVRGSLAPIQQLAVTARSFARVPGRLEGPPQQELQLSGTIDTLNAITAKRLDTRIAIADEREELRGLASAINNMLDRLDAAYQSQLRFVSDASHELRTPIAVIQGYANLLDRWGKDDPQALQESIEAIKAEATGMQSLVEQLLFLARSDNNSIVLEPDNLDISALAEEVLRDAQVIDIMHPFLADITPGLWVLGDSGLLKQALRIFMDNAIKYTPGGERIKVSAEKDGEWIKVSVSDNGIGIPEEDLPHVLERFYRSDESRARKTGGTGLGLSIAKWTVQRHGGHVEILSRKDVGTKITMVLPAAQPKVEPVELEQAQ